MEKVSVDIIEKIDPAVIYELFKNNPNDYMLGESVRFYIYGLEKEAR